MVFLSNTEPCGISSERSGSSYTYYIDGKRFVVNNVNGPQPHTVHKTLDGYKYAWCKDFVNHTLNKYLLTDIDDYTVKGELKASFPDNSNTIATYYFLSDEYIMAIDNTSISQSKTRKLLNITDTTNEWIDLSAKLELGNVAWKDGVPYCLGVQYNQYGVVESTNLYKITDTDIELVENIMNYKACLLPITSNLFGPLQTLINDDGALTMYFWYYNDTEQGGYYLRSGSGGGETTYTVRTAETEEEINCVVETACTTTTGGRIWVPDLG